MQRPPSIRPPLLLRFRAIGSRLDRPAPAWTVALSVAALLMLPAWLLADHLRYAGMVRDDFVYVSDSRDLGRTVSTLLEPHNAHVVPVFRLWTFALSRLAGRLSEIPSALVYASYLHLVVACLAIRRLIARETRSEAAGLIGMAVLGLSTLNTISIIWYSAGQAMLAGVAVLAALLAVQAWREKQAVWKLVLAVAACIAAPGIWTGGLVAGPAAAVYLWFDGRPSSRRAALAFVMVSTLVTGLLIAAVGTKVEEVSRSGNHRVGIAAKAFEASRSTTLAIPECLIFQNLGLDALLTGPQGLVLCLAIAWSWLRGRKRGPNSLEAAGAVITLLSYLMVYFFRGYMPYEEMRTVGWYHAIPSIGAILFVAGWWDHARVANPGGGPLRPARLTGRGLAAVALVTCGLLLLHLPRAERMLIEGAPKMTPEEAARFPIPELQRLRALIYAEGHDGLQRRALVRLEHAERIAREMGAGRTTVKKLFGRVIVPGIHERQMDSDSVTLLALPDADTRRVDEAALRQALRPYLIVEPEFRPPWLGAAGPGARHSSRLRNPLPQPNSQPPCVEASEVRS